MRSFDVDMFDLTLVSSKSPESVLPDFGRAGGTEESNRPCLSWVLMLMLMLMLMILPCFAALQRRWSSKMIRDDWPKKCWGSFCLHFRFQVFIHHNPFSGHTHTSNQQTLLTAELFPLMLRCDQYQIVSSFIGFDLPGMTGWGLHGADFFIRPMVWGLVYVSDWFWLKTRRSHKANSFHLCCP